MKAIVKPNDGPGLDIVDAPIPDIEENEVLIKVFSASICGSDIPIYTWDDPWTRKTVKPGQIIGHEFCGTVVEVGKNVQNLRPNQRVTAEGHLYCGHCFYCMTGQAHICENQRLIGFDYPGAFAEYIAVPAQNVRLLDKSSPWGIGSLLDPLGNALHAISKVSLLGSRVLITGSGPIGLMTIALSRLAGAELIVTTDVSEYRLKMARQIGADEALSPKEAKIWLEDQPMAFPGGGFDVWFEMSGHPDAVTEGVDLLRPGGWAIFLGLPKRKVSIDIANMIVAKNVTIAGVVGRQINKTWVQAAQLLKNEKFVETMVSIVTHYFTFAEYEKAFRLAQSRQCGKVMLLPDDEMIQKLFSSL